MNRESQWLFETLSPSSRNDTSLNDGIFPEREIPAGNYYTFPLTEYEWETFPAQRLTRSTMQVSRRNRKQAPPSQYRRLQTGQIYTEPGTLKSSKLRHPRLQAAANNRPPMRVGERGKAVEMLQRVLIDDFKFSMPISVRRKGEPDGIYGSETAAKVREFQIKYGLKADGIAGKQTLTKMDELLRKQPSGIKPGTSTPDVATAFADALIAARLSFLNQDNPKRTQFYLDFWKAHPEVPWSLLAHLVSRNAGYQMSDLLRYNALSSIPTGLGVPPEQFRRFLEAGNFLIFHDVAPQLIAYSVAKKFFLTTGNPNSSLVFDELLKLGVDPEIVKEWHRFFRVAIDSTSKPLFWKGVVGLESDPAIVRQSVALIVNEQSYLEVRLVNPSPGSPVYVSLSPERIAIIMKVFQMLRLTKLVFPASPPSSPAIPSELLLHNVGDFSSLVARIETGRKLFKGTFLVNASRTEAIKRWAVSSPKHDGSRQNYDSANYSPSVAPSLIPGKRPKFSPVLPLGLMPGWSPPPAPGLPNWSTIRGTGILFTAITSPLPPDAFSGAEGKSLPAISSRELEEIVY